MAHYPEILLARQTYPVLKNDDVKNNTLVRETMADVYQFLTKPGYEPDSVFILTRKNGKLFVKDCELSGIPETLGSF